MTGLSQDSRTIFLGQAVRYPGTAMTTTLTGVPEAQKFELPVAEEMQMGMSIGLALQGFVPVSIYPRWNFLLLAANQIVNHLDKLPLLGGYKPKVIIRVGSASDDPLDPGPQHLGDFSGAFGHMCKTIWFSSVYSAQEVVVAYHAASLREGSTIITEYSELYD